MNNSIEPAIDAASGNVPGVTTNWLFNSPRCGYNLWECRRASESCRDERTQGLAHRQLRPFGRLRAAHPGAAGVGHRRDFSASPQPGRALPLRAPLRLLRPGEHDRRPPRRAARPAGRPRPGGEGEAGSALPAAARPWPLPRLLAPAPARPPPPGSGGAGAAGDRGGGPESSGRGGQRGAARPAAAPPSAASRREPGGGTPRTSRRCCRGDSASGSSSTTSPARSTSPPTISAGSSARRSACRSIAI